MKFFQIAVIGRLLNKRVHRIAHSTCAIMYNSESDES